MRYTVDFDDVDLAQGDKIERIIRAIRREVNEPDDAGAPEPEVLATGLSREQRQVIYDRLQALPFKNDVEHTLLQVWRDLAPSERITYDELWERCGRPDRVLFARVNMHLGRMFHLAQYYGGPLWHQPIQRTRVDGVLRDQFQVNEHYHPDAADAPAIRAA